MNGLRKFGMAEEASDGKLYKARWKLVESGITTYAVASHKSRS